MKLLRILIVAVASLALALPAAAMATAQPAAAPKPQRVITEELKNKPHSILFRIKVRDYANKRTVLQKATCKKCTFKDYAKKRTNDRGRVTYRLEAPNNGKWYWRVYTPKTVNFKKTFSRTAYTYQV